MLEAVRKETDTYLDDFARFEGVAGEPNWLTSLRKDAIRRFSDLGLPTTRDEDWKYTNLRPQLQVPFRVGNAIQGEQTASDTIKNSLFGKLDCPRVVFVDGVFSESLSDLGGIDEGIRVQRFRDVLADEPEFLEKHLGSIADHRDQALTSLNLAFLSDGLCIRTAVGATPEEPVQLIYVSTSGASDQMTTPRILFVAGSNSECRLVETYMGEPETRAFTNSVVEIRLESNAHLKHYKIQLESRKTLHVSRIRASQERDSSYTCHNIALGASLARNEISTVLDGEGGISTLNGLYAVRDRQHVDNFTSMEHAQPNCDSRELYKGVLDGQARAVFHGRIIVRKGAQKTDSVQTNNNLLLTDNALVNTKPQLEIYADDVKCTHGATIGQLEPDQMFYMRSRGISEVAARSLLIYAFASEVAEAIDYGPLRRQLQSYLSEWLPGGRLLMEAESA